MIKKILAGAMLALCFATCAGAASVRPMLLDEIIDTAAIAFHGTCIANLTAVDPATNLIVTYTTFEVRDTIKGSAAGTHVIKQIGGTMPDGKSGLLVQGVPTFAVGQEYVVFLAGVSSLGFSSPVGLSQGNFPVQQGAAEKVIASGADFRDLTARMPRAVLPATSRPIRRLNVEVFKELARSHARLRE